MVLPTDDADELRAPQCHNGGRPHGARVDLVDERAVRLVQHHPLREMGLLAAAVVVLVPLWARGHLAGLLLGDLEQRLGEGVVVVVVVMVVVGRGLSNYLQDNVGTPQLNVVELY